MKSTGRIFVLLLTIKGAKRIQKFVEYPKNTIKILYTM